MDEWLRNGQSPSPTHLGACPLSLFGVRVRAIRRASIDTEVHRPPPNVVALLSALDAYANWLCNMAGHSGMLGGDTSVGRSELQKVLDIRRASFPHLTQTVIEVLVAHSAFAGLLYERQHRALRGAAPQVFDDQRRCADLEQRQRLAIGLLRLAVASPELSPFSLRPYRR